MIDIGTDRTCACRCGDLNCLTAKEWVKAQAGVWRFSYEGRDVRDRSVHPAAYPIALARKAIELFTHEGELVLDPFCGSGTTLVAVLDAGRNAVGVDLSPDYAEYAQNRVLGERGLFTATQQVVIQGDALSIPEHLRPGSVSAVVTSPPYADMLNRKLRNKSRRDRRKHKGQILRYSDDSRDLGNYDPHNWARRTGIVMRDGILPVLRPGAHCLINVGTLWRDDECVPLHLELISEMRYQGFELRNIMIWDKSRLVNGTGIFGYPSNYIVMYSTYEYLLHFRAP